MRICVYGAGAIGGLVAGRLARTGCDVSVVARGAHLAAIRARGLHVRSQGEAFVVHPPASDDPTELGPHDYVILTLKAHSVAASVAALPALFGPDTALVTAMNGVPFWYFHGLDGPWRDHRLASVDPGDRQWQAIGPERALGCVVYPACRIVEPGVVEHLDYDALVIGEPSGATTARARALCDALSAAGFKAPLVPDIRNAIWTKLWGNVCFNPISALTRGTVQQIADDPGTLEILRAVMREAQAIAETLGARFPVTLEQRIANLRALGAHKTSMLQDLERGRPLEIDALVSAVQEMGRLVNAATPILDTLLALVRQRAAR
jgi:2-dehydropantoate 2-reductase